jgi:hypothetical protein
MQVVYTPIQVGGDVEFGVRRIQLAAREDVRAAENARRGVPLQQQHLQSFGCVAQHHDAGRRARCRRHLQMIQVHRQAPTRAAAGLDAISRARDARGVPATCQ